MSESNVAKPRELKWTHKRVITKRGVMWLGQTCNLRCYFCYFIDRVANSDHPEHAFMSLDKAKKMCDVLRYTYGNTSIDIQGGEPTIFKDILALCSHCNEIGLYPTLITNGLVLTKPERLEAYRQAGVRDFLVSLHGIGDIHDDVVCVKGAYEKIIASLTLMQQMGIPFRINCTMSKPVIPVLTEVAQKAVDFGALAVNFIAFNPFGDQQTGRRRTDTVASYSDVARELTKAIDKVEAAGIEVNVRYLPICLAEERHRKNFYNFQQLSYDHHEWDYQSWSWSMMQPQMMKEGGLIPPYFLGPYNWALRGGDHRYIRDHATRNPYRQALKFWGQRTVSSLLQALRGQDAVWRDDAKYRAAHDCCYQYHEGCQRCSARQICDGFHGDYVEFFGTSEAKPITGIPEIQDPTHYIREQDKYVEPEDESWAL